jgi:hypothetical protein
MRALVGKTGIGFLLAAIGKRIGQSTKCRHVQPG